MPEATVKVKCEQCGIEFDRRLAEVKRSKSIGRLSFCSLECAGAYFANVNRKPKITKTCEFCGKEFVTTANRHEARFCSRSCASKGSMTEERREAQRAGGKKSKKPSISEIADGLRKREAPKYKALSEFMDAAGIEYKFEFPVSGYVFDLYLPKSGLLIEFDGPYHGWGKQSESDNTKELSARNSGFRVVRVVTGSGNKPIDPDVIKVFL